VIGNSSCTRFSARQKSRDEFMSEIADMTRHMVERAKKFRGKTRFPAISACSKRHVRSVVARSTKNTSAFQCVNEKCDFSIWKTLCGRMF